MDTLKINKIETTADYKVYLTYSNGELRLFDMKPLLEMKPWAKINSREKFSMAQIQFNTIVWPNGIDIAPETLYLDSIEVSLPVK